MKAMHTNEGVSLVSEVRPRARTLAAGRYRWVQQVNFIVFGLLMIAFAVELQLGVRPTRAGVAGPHAGPNRHSLGGDTPSASLAERQIPSVGGP